MYPGLRVRAREVDHHEVPRARGGPTPCDEGTVGVVVWPAGALAQQPVALAQLGVSGRAQQPFVEAAQIGVDRLVGTAADEYRNMGAALELPIVIQTRALER